MRVSVFAMGSTPAMRKFVLKVVEEVAKYKPVRRKPLR
jgi:hypothetical protein